MTRTASLRVILAAEVAIFALAAAAHRGWIGAGFEHARAATAETAIALFLLLGFHLVKAVPEHGRAIGLIAHVFALVGALTGVLVVALGVGPQTGPDKIYLAATLTFLVAVLPAFIRNACCQRAACC